ncbi:phosphopentomutase [Carboxydothermus hydrogenoformans]|uniref:Phosphopentomutase n=1 Tax=Carboxydothermus hydrogenoformans (strain ATCC BAA-161 / DSM 6008 / Z-2901) TaxID=246194 RepID=DEOB_CARHZ|nr:phosphopentomutase [Carboxydothermus hydrogenoformans]Q3AAQ2.1 RecName: Full=Phosphopentomutase; AltName: Full=Phosphodeoxyribomutase [Carboxydothermus hydrogenoformans Z-2901]ABB15249.1 phosphopentomutase [Carboxydothermus hydrogenoformans Z-2901]
MKRVVLIVLDSVGIGELPDAHLYGDEGSNTLANTAKKVGGFELPNLEKLGLGKIHPILGLKGDIKALGAYGKMGEKSPGKDTTTGHWEICGLILEKPFPVYPNGFPEDLIKRFEEAIGRKTLGNKPASGTAIIEELGEEHMRTGYPIVYTSADSVFQIAAHEEVIPLEELYKMCKIARGLLTGEHAVGRVIARPFTGTPGNFKRTANRHDYSLEPTGKTVLDKLVEQGYEVLGVGKIYDIFAGRGLTWHESTKNNEDGLVKTVNLLYKDFTGLLFTNLVDFDMVYGHRNNAEGYYEALKQFDSYLPKIMEKLREDDLLIITADHGCDPTTPSTDHSREYVPLLVYGHSIKEDVNLGTRETFADVAATLEEIFGLEPGIGQSFWGEIRK